MKMESELLTITIVIICKNAENTILRCINSALALSDDVIVVDNGSTDGSLKIIQKTDARLIQTEWLGYGATKNLGNEQARYPWILSLDADELIDNVLIKTLSKLEKPDDSVIYGIKRINYLGKYKVKYGEWGHGVVWRIFNKNKVAWDLALVHEQLVRHNVSKAIKIKGSIYHFTANNIEEYSIKLDKYARLMAKKYAAANKKSALQKRIFAPLFNFIKNYFFRRGFLDGKAGLQIALAHANYTHKKYLYLKREISMLNHANDLIIK